MGFLAVLSLVLPFHSMALPNVYATNNIILNDSTSCALVGGAWTTDSGGNNVCDIFSLTLVSGDILTIPAGSNVDVLGTVIIPAGALVDISNQLSVHGTLDNSGTMIVEPGAFFFPLAGSIITNHGSIIIGDGGLLTTNFSFTNFGSIIVNGQGQLDIIGTFTNNAGGVITLNNPLHDSFTLLDESGVFNNAGQIINRGVLYNIAATYTNSAFINNNGGQLTNDNSFTNAGTILNCNGILDGASPVTLGTIIPLPPSTTCNQISSSTTVTLNPSTIPIGSFTTVLVQVTGSSPTGSIVFSDSTGTFSPASCTLDSSGQCSVSYMPTTTGPVTITATYYDDQNNLASADSKLLTVVSSGSNPTPTTTTVSSSLNPSTLGQPVTFTAAITPSTATGTVQFQINGTNFGSPISLSAGQAVLTTSLLPLGVDNISVVYSGDSNFNPSTSSIVKISVHGPTKGKVTGEGHLGKYVHFEFDVKSKDGKTFKGHLEYNDKSKKIDLDSKKITLLSVYNSFTNATFVGQAKLDDHSGKLSTFLVQVTDTDKPGSHDDDEKSAHDMFSIILMDSTGAVTYQNSGTVQGHIEIDKLTDKDDDHNGDNHSNDHNGHGDDHHDKK